jgi:putative transposase
VRISNCGWSATFSLERRHGRCQPPTRWDKDVRPAPDLVDRDFVASRLNQLWVADITFVPTVSGFLHLAVVLDACSRKIVGWSMANHPRTEMVLDALDMAIANAAQVTSSTTATRGANTRRSRWASSARKQACARRWARSGTPTTTPCARLSSQRSDVRSQPPWARFFFH